jgi:hypothetical protein
MDVSQGLGKPRQILCLSVSFDVVFHGCFVYA